MHPNTSGGVIESETIQDQQLAEKLHKLIIRKLKKKQSILFY